MPMPAAVMSPDDMLRAYAERKKSVTTTSGAPISYPVPIATPMSPTNTGNARSLYSPTGAVVSTQNGGYGNYGQYGGARYDDDDGYTAYRGTAS